MPQIKVYTTEICPRCKQLKETLKSKKMSYEELDLSKAEALTELRVNGVFTTSAPVIQIDDEFFTSDDLFDENGVNTDLISSLYK